MSWLQTHAYIAAWLSPTITLIGLIIQNAKPDRPIDWHRTMLFVAFLTCLAAIFTPGIDGTVRIFAESTFTILLFAIYWDMPSRR
jgi:uncharacterized membrane protein